MSVSSAYTVTVSGTYKLHITFSTGGSIFGYPRQVTAIAGDLDASQSLFTMISPFGVTGTATAGDIFRYRVQARDMYRNMIAVGGAGLTTSIATGTPIAMSDDNSGAYSFNTPISVAGPVFVAVFDSLGRGVAATPVTVTVLTGLASAAASTAEGSGIRQGPTGAALPIIIRVKDAYGNPLQSYSGVVALSVTPGSSTFPIAIEKAVYSASITGTTAATHLVTIRVGGSQINGSPFGCSITAAAVTVLGPPLATNSFAAGEGLTRTTAGVSTTFTIQAVNEAGQYMRIAVGGFSASLSKGGITVQGAVEYSTLGLYSASYSVTVSGEYQMQVLLYGVNTRGSPFATTVAPGIPSASHCTAEGVGLTVGTAGSPGTFSIKARDTYGNLLTRFGTTASLRFTASSSGPGPASVSIDPDQQGATVSYLFTVGGQYTWSLSLSGSPISAALQLNLLAGAPSPAYTTLVGEGVNVSVAGKVSSFKWCPADAFGTKTLGFASVSPQIAFAPGGPQVALVRTQTCVDVSYTATQAGSYKLQATLNSGGTPFSIPAWDVSVVAGDIVVPMSLATGTGASTATAGYSVTFGVQAQDRFGNTVTRSNLTFTVLVGGSERQLCSTLPSSPCSYMVTRSGSLALSVTKEGVHILGSPLSVSVMPDEFYQPAVTVSGHGLSLATAGSLTTFTVLSRDKFGNALTSGLLRFSAVLEGTRLIDVGEQGLLDKKDGTYIVSYTPTVAGAYSIHLSRQLEYISGSPYALNVQPGIMYPPLSTTAWPTLLPCSAGAGLCGTVAFRVTCVMSLRDTWGNLASTTASEVLARGQIGVAVQYGLAQVSAVPSHPYSPPLMPCGIHFFLERGCRVGTRLAARLS